MILTPGAKKPAPEEHRSVAAGWPKFILVQTGTFAAAPPEPCYQVAERDPSGFPIYAVMKIGLPEHNHTMRREEAIKALAYAYEKFGDELPI